MTHRFIGTRKQLGFGLATGFLLVGIGLLCLLSLHANVAHAAGTIFVRTDGSDTNCDGTAAVAYPGAGGPGLACAKMTIQAGIDAVDPGGTVSVYPGTYSETASGRTLTSIGGTYTFGLFVSQAKSGITVQGVNAGGSPITSYANTAATVNTNATNDFGPSGVFIEGDNVTIAGLKIGTNSAGQNKTVEVIGDNFSLKNSDIVDPQGSVYLNDFRYDTGTNTSHVKSYTIDGNFFEGGVSLDLASGAGYSGPASGRVIKNNKFDLNNETWPSISFNGSGTDVPWFVYSVGGAVIQNNQFVNGAQQYIRARGTYDNTQFDWASYFNGNTFDRAVVVGPNPPADLRPYSYTSGTYNFSNVRHISTKIQSEIDNGQSGDTVLVKAGSYPENLLINKSLTIKGAQAGVLAKGRAGAQSIIVASNGSNPIDIQADDVTLNGFVFNGTAATSQPWIITALSGPGSDGRYSNIKILYNEFVGNPGNGTFPGGMYLLNHDNALIEGNYFNKLGQHAVFMAGTSTNTTYRNNDSLGNYNSNFSTHDTQHTGVLIENNRAVDDDMILFALRDATIRNNTLTSSTTVARIWLGGNDQRVSITGNTSTGLTGPAIQVVDAGFYPGTNNSDITISKNTITANVALLTDNYSMIDLRDVGGTNTVSENKITLSGTFTNPVNAAYGIGVRGKMGTLNVSANELKGNGITGSGVPGPSGIFIRSNSANGPLLASTVITGSNNLITGFVNGITIFDVTNNVYGGLPAGTTVKFNLNSLAGNSDYGFRSGPGGKADATSNWWGSATGPTNAANPGGTGTKVSDNVDFSPWLCDGTDTSPATGFQPNPNTLCGVAKKLIFSTQPGNGTVGQPISPQPVVKALDENGNLAINFNGPVTLTIGNNPGGGTLSGTTTVNAVNGVATFSGLSINQPGNGYTLIASSPGLTSATSQPFNITGSAVTTCGHPTLAQLSAYRPLGDTNGNANPSYPLSNLIDNSNVPNDQTMYGTFWAWTNYPRAVALQVDYGAGNLKTVSSFKIFSHDVGKAPNVYFQFSQNGTTWYDIPGLNNINTNAAYGYSTYNVSPSITARFFRAVIDNTTFLNDVGYWSDFQVCSSSVTLAPSGPTAPVAHQLPITSASSPQGGNPANVMDGQSSTNWVVSGNKPSAELDIDLGATRTISSLSYFQTNAAVARSTNIQYWNGSAWVTIPGQGAVNTGDYSFYGSRTINFASPITTSKIRFVITNTNNDWALGGYGDVKVFGY